MKQQKRIKSVRAIAMEIIYKTLMNCIDLMSTIRFYNAFLNRVTPFYSGQKGVTPLRTALLRIPVNIYGIGCMFLLPIVIFNSTYI